MESTKPNQNGSASILSPTVKDSNSFPIRDNLGSLAPFNELIALSVSLVNPVNLQATKRAKFFSLFCATNMIFIPTLQAKAPRRKFGNEPEVQFCDRLIARANHSDIQKKPLRKQDQTIFVALTICVQPNNVFDATA